MTLKRRRIIKAVLHKMRLEGRLCLLKKKDGVGHVDTFINQNV
jgi:hypothetical protein